MHACMSQQVRSQLLHQSVLALYRDYSNDLPHAWHRLAKVVFCFQFSLSLSLSRTSHDPSIHFTGCSRLLAVLHSVLSQLSLYLTTAPLHQAHPPRPPSLALLPQSTRRRRETDTTTILPSPLSLSLSTPSLLSLLIYPASFHGTQQQSARGHGRGSCGRQRPRRRRRAEGQGAQGRARERQVPVPRRAAAELGQVGGGDPGAAEALPQVARHLRHRRGRRARLRPRRAPPLRPPRAPQPHLPAAAYARRAALAPALLRDVVVVCPASAPAAPAAPAAAPSALQRRLCSCTGFPPPPPAVPVPPPLAAGAADTAAILRQHGHGVHGHHHCADTGGGSAGAGRRARSRFLDISTGAAGEYAGGGAQGDRVGLPRRRGGGLRGGAALGRAGALLLV